MADGGYSQCRRSKGKGFIRIDNCRRHMRTVHGFSAEEARRCVVAQGCEQVGQGNEEV